MDPDHRGLADYVGWIMAKRINASDRLEDKCLNNPDLEYLNTVCQGLVDSLSIRNPPFTWDLKNSLTLDEYLASVAQSNGSATPTAGT
jgi:hypothetical protein